MFLNQLNEDQKELFLELCYHAVMADGNFDQQEMETMPRLCYEMMIPNHMPDTENSLATVLDEILESSSAQEINIIVFELMLLLKSDGNYNDGEKEFIEYVVSTLQLSFLKFENLDTLANRYLLLTNEINDEINEEIED